MNIVLDAIDDELNNIELPRDTGSITPTGRDRE
ncbi:MAG: hypothetical protein BWY92_01081 [Firmicutes bacterium ADurb.BinA052]|jgi:hypothetical protein|nr:MAG: hypothetical protein BWY92_01081 [Firmicutes bacterium ADurb.BinA052]